MVLYPNKFSWILEKKLRPNLNIKENIINLYFCEARYLSFIDDEKKFATVPRTLVVSYILQGQL